MKKLAFAAIAVLLVVPAISSAQSAPKQGQGRAGNAQDFQKRMAQRQKEMRDRMVKDLKLSADQTKKFDVLNKATNDRRAKLFSGGRPDPSKRDAMMKSFEKIQSDHEAGLKKILKADQFAKYQKLMAEMRKRRGGPGGGPGGSAGGRRPGGGA